MIDKRNLLNEFEAIILNAELKALQKHSIREPLSEDQFKRFKELANLKLDGVI